MAGLGRGPRRRQANTTPSREYVHKVRVTAEQELQLTRLAEAARVTVPRLMVESALAGDGVPRGERDTVMTELFAVHRLLAATSRNINQLARAANATGEQPATTGYALQSLHRVLARVDAVLEQVSEL